MLSFVTNATVLDQNRLSVFVPHVLKVFGAYIDEFIIILDRKMEEGRIQRLHDNNQPVAAINEEFLGGLIRLDPRISIFDCDYTQVDTLSRKWFNHPEVIRCQGGTPIFAFTYGLEKCSHDRIIRSDCDIFFLDNGFIGELLSDEQSDIIQLPRLNDEQIAFSSRAFYIRKSFLESKFPLLLCRLDVLRRIHRRLKGRTTFLALEEIIELNARRRRLNLFRQSSSLGKTMHIPRREDFVNGTIVEVLKQFTLGMIPLRQLQINHDYHRELWE